MKIFLPLLIIFFLAGCTSNNLRNLNEDENLAHLILGTWAEDIADDGKIRFYNTYLPEGIMHSYGYCCGAPDDIFYWMSASAKWKVINGSICFEVFHSSNEKYMPVGIKFCYEIVSVSKEEFAFQGENGDSIAMRRVSRAYLR